MAVKQNECTAHLRRLLRRLQSDNANVRLLTLTVPRQTCLGEISLEHRKVFATERLAEKVSVGTVWIALEERPSEMLTWIEVGLALEVC